METLTLNMCVLCRHRLVYMIMGGSIVTNHYHFVHVHVLCNYHGEKAKCTFINFTKRDVTLHLRFDLLDILEYNRGTYTVRIVSVEYLFGRPIIASDIWLGKCHLELS